MVFKVCGAVTVVPAATLLPLLEPIETLKAFVVLLLMTHMPATPCGSKTVWFAAKAPVRLNRMACDVEPAAVELGAAMRVYVGDELVLTDTPVVLPNIWSRMVAL